MDRPDPAPPSAPSYAEIGASVAALPCDGRGDAVAIRQYPRVNVFNIRAPAGIILLSWSESTWQPAHSPVRLIRRWRWLAASSARTSCLTKGPDRCRHGRCTALVAVCESIFVRLINAQNIFGLFQPAGTMTPAPGRLYRRGVRGWAKAMAEALGQVTAGRGRPLPVLARRRRKRPKGGLNAAGGRAVADAANPVHETETAGLSGGASEAAGPARSACGHSASCSPMTARLAIRREDWETHFETNPARAVHLAHSRWQRLSRQNRRGWSST